METDRKTWASKPKRGIPSLTNTVIKMTATKSIFFHKALKG